MLKDPEQYNHVLQSWESSDEGESDDDDQLKANVRNLTIVALCLIHSDHCVVIVRLSNWI